MSELSAQWNALPPRTRQLVLIGAVAIALVLLVTAVWMPLQKDLTRLRAAVPLETEQLNWMRAQAPLAKNARARVVTSSGSLTSTIEQSAATHGVRTYITKIEQEGGNGARVSIEAIPFNTLVTWMTDVQAAQGAVIEDAAIDAHATTGMVNARLRLRAGGA